MKKNDTQGLHLASSSPRRQQILQSLGLTFSVQGVDIDEQRLEGEAPADMVLRLAAAKAVAASVDDAVVVLGSDTAVVLGDRVLGKPDSREGAIETLLQLSGQYHQVMTGVAVKSDSGVATALSVTDVRFREIRRDEAEHYWQSGEPRDKAGAYGIQGLGGIFVVSIRGSYSGVVGLPVFETVMLLNDAGINVIAGPND